MEGGQDLYRVFSDSVAAEDRERTFLGNVRLSTRAALFLLLGLGAVILTGSVFLYADMKLSTATNKVAAAQETAELAGRVERMIWQIRSATENVLLRPGPQSLESYERKVTAVSALLSTLYSRPETSLIREHITTISDGLGQHATAFRDVVDTRNAIGTSTTSGLANRMHVAGQNLEAALAKTDLPGLRYVTAIIRKHEAAFILNAAKQDLTQIDRLSKEFSKALAAATLPGRQRTRIGDLMAIYQTNLTAFARARINQDEGVGRLDELFAYVVPSIENLATFAQDMVALAFKEQREARALVRLVVPLGVVTAITVLTLLGFVLMRSVTAPVSALAEASDALVDGDDDVAVPALGNTDEVGNLARTLTLYSAHLAEISHLRGELGRVKNALDAKPQPVAAETGAATATKGHLVPHGGLAGSTALTEPAGPPGNTLSGPISSVSRQVARSSQSVSTAAFEAERAGALIRGLMAAETRIANLVALLGTVREQTNLRVAVSRPRGGSDDDADQHLVVLSSEAADAGTGDGIAQRLEALRNTADEAAQAVRDVGESVAEIKAVALDIAASTSAEALSVTTALLEQSEYLRGMLDDLIDNIHDTSDESAMGDPPIRDVNPPPPSET
jgi:methyl-accepting chemotaxis protein